jgi:hypothetical protein
MTTLVHLSISKLRMKYQSIVGVLGNVQVVASPNYEVVESRRRIKKDKNNAFEPTEDVCCFYDATLGYLVTN